MPLHLIINDKEIRNPVVKYLILALAVFISTVLTLLILFLILPLIGIAATLSIGFIISLFFAVIISIPALIIFALIFNKLSGGTQISIRPGDKPRP